MTKSLILFLVFSAFVSVLFAQPANDNCIDAIQITNLDGECLDFNSTMSTFDLVNGSCIPNQGNRNTWFSFIAQGPDLDISVDGGPNDIYTTLISFDPNPCEFASVTQLACGAASGDDTAISLVGNLTIGNTYFIIVNVGNNAEAPGTICVNNPDPNAVISVPSFGQYQLFLLGLVFLIIGGVKLNTL